MKKFLKMVVVNHSFRVLAVIALAVIFSIPYNLSEAGSMLETVSYDAMIGCGVVLLLHVVAFIFFSILNIFRKK